MNREEAGRVVALFKATWPNHPVADPGALVASWHLALGDARYAEVQAAAAAWLREGRFFPAPAEIRKLLLDADPSLPSGGEAWRMVLARMRGTYPGIPAPAWDAPEPVRATAKEMGGIGVLRSSEEPGADQARFLRLYEVNRQRAARRTDLSAPALGGATPAVGAGTEG